MALQQLNVNGNFKRRLFIHALLPLILIMILATESTSNDLITARVVGVADGDNIIVLTARNQRIVIKLGGIDCPEIGQATAIEAMQFLFDQCMGKNIQYRIIGIDIYDRIIATVYLEDGKELNLEILKAGFAWYDKRHLNRQDYADAERHARASRLGLWVDENPTPPWKWRRKRR